jgi:ribonuclease P protein component
LITTDGYHEAHLSTQQARSRPPPRLSFAYGDAGWPQRDPRSPSPWPQGPVGLSDTGELMLPLRRMVWRSEFLKANGGTRVPMPAFVLLVRPRGDDEAEVGYGITATKKLGGAVIRNRAKRRFRAIIRDQFPSHALSGADHVLIARRDALTQPHAALTADIVKALAKAKRRMQAAAQ